MKIHVIIAIILAGYFTQGFSQLAPSQHKIGESFGGGIIFHISEDGKHGLIVEKQKDFKSCNWEDAKEFIKKSENHNESAKQFTDWRLPTIEEYEMIYKNLKIKNLCSEIIENFCFADKYYWSSSTYIYTDRETGEQSFDYAWYFNFNTGEKDWTAMGNSNTPFCIREF